MLNIMHHLKQKIKERRQVQWRRRPVLLRRFTQPQSYQGHGESSWTEVWWHLPNLAPSNFSLFRNFKRFLPGSDSGVIGDESLFFRLWQMLFSNIVKVMLNLKFSSICLFYNSNPTKCASSQSNVIRIYDNEEIIRKWQCKRYCP